MTTTAMKRAGQLVAHLGILHQISDVRQLLLLQLAMRERQDQVVLFKRQDGAVTLSLIGAQLSAPTDELSHRAGNVTAAVLLEQLQAISGIRGDDVAFSNGQIHEMITTQTQKIEASEGLAKLDAALLNLVGKLEQELQQGAGELAEPASASAGVAGDPDPQEAEGSEPESSPAGLADLRDSAVEETQEENSAEPDLGLSSVRASRRRSA